MVGHIEDIVTHKEYRGHSLGLRIIETLVAIGKSQRCYKSHSS
jgi:glucosamine-phosphate N-acetyltransferase